MPAQVFISYAHADDRPFDEDAPGWVSYFVDKLINAVGRHAGGSQVDFWMDPRLEPQRRVNDELRRRIRESRVILSFLSPRYLESVWCREEMATFVAEVGGGVSADRVFLVEVLPTERSRWHTAIQDLSPVTFWTKSLTRPEPRTLGWPLPNVKGDRDYWDEINSLASILARQIRNLPPEPATPTQAPATATPSPPPPPSGPGSDAPLSVLINADPLDRDLGKQAQEILGELDVDAILAAQPLPGQPPAEYRQQLEATLQDSHGVLIIYGTAPPTWVQAQHAHARKVLAQVRKGLWGGLLDGPPLDKPDSGLPPRNLMILPCRQGICREPLDRFVQALRAGSAHV